MVRKEHRLGRERKKSPGGETKGEKSKAEKKGGVSERQLNAMGKKA